VGESRTHYQISLTARQAVGLFVGLLGALGVAYFLGVKTGLAGRDREPRPDEKLASAAPAPGPAAAAAGASEPAVPPVETGIPIAARGADPAATPPPPEPTPPATIHPFEDASEEESPSPADAGSRTSVVGAPAAPASKAPPASGKGAAPASKAAAAPPPSGKVWVQAASLSSRDEAGALSARLAKRGFHAVVSTGSGAKGTVYRVRVGPYRNEEEASHAVTKLSKQEKIREPWIVPEGK